MFERFKEAFRKQYGGKAFGAMELLQEYAKRLGFKVPEFENIGTDIFKGFLEHNSITRDAINEIYARNIITDDSNAYEQVKDLFYEGKFTEEQERELRKVFDAMRALGHPIIAIRSSSVLEDSEEHQFKGIYESEFLYFSQDAEKDFALFKEKIKKVYATIFSPKARWYLKENNIPNADEMGILVQKVVGKLHKTIFYPPLSGVTLFEPYSPDTTVSYLNLGLNTKTVRGEYMWKWVCIADSSGQRHISGSEPYLVSAIGRVKKYYDIIGTTYGGAKVIENYKDGARILGNLFSKYSSDKKDFLQKLNGRPNNMEFTRGLTLKIDNIAREIREGKGKPIEMEWSVDDNGDINIYQDRFSYDFEKFYSEKVELKDIPSERVIAESDLISGHGEISAPLVLITDVFETSTASLEYVQSIIGEEFILAVDLDKFKGDEKDINSEYFSYTFPNMIGILNLSEEPVPLGAHWSEYLINSKIPIISTTKINNDLLNKICSNIEFEARYSTVPVKMAINGREKKGRIWVSEQEKLDATFPVTLDEKLMHFAPETSTGL